MEIYIFNVILVIGQIWLIKRYTWIRDAVILEVPCFELLGRIGAWEWSSGLITDNNFAWTICRVLNIKELLLVFESLKSLCRINTSCVLEIAIEALLRLIGLLPSITESFSNWIWCFISCILVLQIIITLLAIFFHFAVSFWIDWLKSFCWIFEHSIATKALTSIIRCFVIPNLQIFSLSWI